MKTNKISSLPAAALFTIHCSLFTACADTDMVQMQIEEPVSLADHDYLKSYDALKTYGDIGVAMDAADWLADGMASRIAAANFTQLVPGTAFCHQQVVKTNGAIDTTVIAQLGARASARDMSLMSSPLVWHRHQNTAWLESLVSPNVIRPEGDEGGYCLQMTNTALAAAATDAQVAYTFARTPQVEPGIKYRLTMMVRGTAEGVVGCATYSNARGSRFSPDISVTRQWQQVSLTCTMASGIKGLTSILFNLGQYAGTLYVDDIALYEIDNKGREVTDNLNTQNADLDDMEATALSTAIQTDVNHTLEDVGVSALGDGYDPLATYVEKTPEEKRTILTEAMSRYLEGVMTVRSTNVSDWLVLNEPLDEDRAEGAFYWQDYLGNPDYAVAAFREAARHTTARLYIGESGLAGNTAKQQRLVSLIQQLESQGVQVDGIAVTITATAGTQTDYAVMFQTLARTGKFVKIADLQVAVEPTDGIVTESQFIGQAEVYRDILTAYCDQVPAAQRGGIVQHQVLDTDQPLGLWSQDYSRKHAYGAVAEIMGKMKE